MSDKINYANCMKRKCEQCRYYDYCFRYRPEKEVEKIEYKQVKYRNYKHK